MNILRWLLITQLKRCQKQKENGGFTLIELLVAMILAVLVITPLMGFMINVLDTDRQEQAKATSEQEIQTAIDYITRDLQQAVYIYDADALNKDSNPDDAKNSGIKNQIPDCNKAEAKEAKCQPILVFWKREFATEVIGKDNDDDSFVYSLVAYYLIKDNNPTWSKAARISRFEISDGVLNNNNGEQCPNAYDTDNKFTKCPDQGFQPLNLTEKGKNVQQKMNTWKKGTQDYNKDPLVLVDFIDQTANGAPSATCPPNPPDPPDPSNPIQWSKISAESSDLKATGFYVCVISVAPGNKSVAEVYLRGNALARLTNDESNMVYNSNKSSYFPKANVRVQGRSFIFTK